MDSKSLVSNFFKYAYTNTEGKRSVFPYGKSQKSSFMVGRLVPAIAPIPVLPSDTFSLNFAGLFRSGTLVAPLLDDLYLEVVAVWVPDRIVWEHYLQWLGENDSTAWTQSNTYVRPSIKLPTASTTIVSAGNGGTKTFGNDLAGVTYGNYFLNCHFGLPAHVGTNDISINCLPHRGYYAMWNQLFRNPNWQRPVLYSKTDTGASGEFGYFFESSIPWVDSSGNITTTSSSDNFVGSNAAAKQYRPVLMPVNKIRDFVTTLLPEPQAGIATSVPLLGTAPVKAYTDNGIKITSDVLDLTGGVETNSSAEVFIDDGYGNQGGTPKDAFLKVDLSQSSAVTIENLRQSVMAQHYKEMLARGGQYADDILNTFFGVSDSRLMADKVEILCHKKFRVGISQVVATADSTDAQSTQQVSHLGETGAYSLTGIKTSLFTKSFTEHGHIHICYFVRGENVYCGGLDEEWTQLEKFDTYWSPFDHIGEVGVNARVLNATSDNIYIGYQEAWYMYRTQRNKAVGAMDVSFTDSMNWWTLGTAYGKITSSGGFGPSFFCEFPDNFDRDLLASHTISPQFFSDVRISGKMARRMSPHSNPGIFGLL